MSSFADIVLRHRQWEEQQQQKKENTSLSSGDINVAPLRGPAVADEAKDAVLLNRTTAAVLPLSATGKRPREAPLQGTCRHVPTRAAVVPSLAVRRRNRNAPLRPEAVDAAGSASLYTLPYKPYPVQEEMMRTMASLFDSNGAAAVPVLAMEVPTGCGKTLALLSGVMQYQAKLKGMTDKEAEDYQRQRDVWRRAAGGTASGAQARQSHRTTATRACSRVEDEAEEWHPPPKFFEQFRVNTKRKIRAEIDATASAELRRRFLPPPCTVFYATRTHAQIKQCVGELRRLRGAAGQTRMNILGSRDHYCIHPKVVKAKADHTLPVEGNNLGEVCDKLVSLGLCEMVESYGELSCSAIGGPVGRQAGGIWEIEDLVMEGMSQKRCPYYAARDLVWYADITFCSYPYLLDPLIRHESKMEAAIGNHSIVVFDEAHNVVPFCQEALSLECPRAVLALILSELEPLLGTLAERSSDGFATLTYPRDFPLGPYTLSEMFSFLFAMLQALTQLVDALPAYSAESEEESRRAPVTHGQAGDPVPSSTPVVLDGVKVEQALFAAMNRFTRLHIAHRKAAAKSLSTPPAERCESLFLFRRSYGIVMSLGVTFNPFGFSIHTLAHLKRWLLVLRFLLQQPSSFALTTRQVTATAEPVAATGPLSDQRSGPPPSSHPRGMADGSSQLQLQQQQQERRHVATATTFVVEVRCLDGSLAFQHLLRSTHRVVLASGTLSPYEQLRRDIGLAPQQWRTMEGMHVVPPSQFKLSAMAVLPTAEAPATPLRCTYASLSSRNFLREIARCVVRLSAAVVGGGGVLCFTPNYAVMNTLASQTRELLQGSIQAPSPSTFFSAAVGPIAVFVEPRKAAALAEVLGQYRAFTHASQSRTAIFFSVYRGKVSEGIDFADEMARLVLCLGVPLQPLKSWRVVAQRSYSGEGWYTTDAVRSVNQALGRCLRHVRDYGAVILLDERYALADYQAKLSKWCRAALSVETDLAALCTSLQHCFTTWRDTLDRNDQDTKAPSGQRAGVGDRGLATTHIGTSMGMHYAGDGSVRLELGTGQLLGSEQLPFHRVVRSAASSSQLPGLLTRKTSADNSTGAPPPPPDVLHSSLACTAVKLLYESVENAMSVSRAELLAAIDSLKSEFGIV